MSIPRGWKFERIDDRGILVHDPCMSTPIEVSIGASDRRVRSFYNLVVDLMESESEFNQGFVTGAVAFQQLTKNDTNLKFDDNLWDERDE